MKSQYEKALAATDRQPPKKRCSVCGTPEGYSPEGAEVRMIHLADGAVACNFCNNQIADESLRGSGRLYGEFETVKRTEYSRTVTEGFEDNFERQGSYSVP